MDRYGRDDRSHRGWLQQAEDTVQGWFGRDHHDYDRDYGPTRGYTGGRVVERISPGYDRDRVRFVDRGYDRDFGGRGYAGRDYARGYDNRDFGGARTTPSGYVAGRGSMGYGADYDRGYRGGYASQNRGFGNRGYGAYDYNRGGQYGAGGGADLTRHGLDDRFGTYDMNRFRSGSGGAWRSGGYYTGYGFGSPQGYMP